jgi:diaminopimelate epimerase
MRIRFTKMQGAGNDFVLLDETTGVLPLTAAHYRRLADRRFGVGADQVLGVRAAPSPEVDFEYVIHNADGGEVQQCGNGARCFVHYVRENKLTDKSRIRVQTRAGVIELIEQPDGEVTVDMGEPVFDLPRVPFDPAGLTPRSVADGQRFPKKPSKGNSSMQQVTEPARRSTKDTGRFGTEAVAHAQASKTTQDVKYGDTGVVNKLGHWNSWSPKWPEDAETVENPYPEPLYPSSLAPPNVADGQLWPLVLPGGAGTVVVAVLSMGNPHAVQLVDDVDDAPVAEQGPLIERHRAFPERVNAGFMQIVKRGEIRLRVYERGAGETLACGTGACAAVVAGVRLGLLDTRVRVRTRGGALTIEWAGGAHDPVRMTGPAQTVFKGEIDLPEDLA